MQTLYLATEWNPIYWNTACLIVNSGAIDPETSGSTDYAKLAKAIGDIRKAGIHMSLADINYSNYGFKPDSQRNQIVYGLKAILNVGDEVIENTLKYRPYSSIKDFYYKVKPNKQAMIALIKGGAFDIFMNRKLAMGWFIWETCEKKNKLTLQNMAALLKYHIFTLQSEEEQLALRYYEFNRYLKAVNANAATLPHFILDNRAINFLISQDLKYLIDNNKLNKKDWDKIYQSQMDVFRELLKVHYDEYLQAINEKIFLADWNKYALGTLSSWEMEVLCFYYHEHELNNVNLRQYGISSWNTIPELPSPGGYYFKGKVKMPLYKIYRICGTCIAKNKTKGTVSLLTPNGDVVTVRFRKEYFSLFDKRITARNADGVKNVIEKSWFDRGSKIIVTGVRSDNDFIVKKYASIPGHQLYKITQVNNENITLTYTRAQGMEEDEEE